MYRFDRKVSDSIERPCHDGDKLLCSVAGGVHSDSAFAVPDLRSAVRGGGVGGGAVSGDDAGCYSRFRVGTRSWST
ncbi:hypothetical protein RHMOL_Rhmol06G0252800 [Rhododendron molle]|uniref:Uncharacterized protein n=1 Tax=Rhododendron molle TaxID=49168 RepID=A0ACC0NFV8_RHOML|nr:hypothetical protein RHMOL_Rhmol06G0252800 [Rhododendron molle]